MIGPGIVNEWESKQKLMKHIGTYMKVHLPNDIYESLFLLVNALGFQ